MQLKFKTVEEIGQATPTDGQYYDLFVGGYLNPVDFLSDKEQIDEVNKAIELVKNYLAGLEENELIVIM